MARPWEFLANFWRLGDEPNLGGGRSATWRTRNVIYARRPSDFIYEEKIFRISGNPPRRNRCCPCPPVNNNGILLPPRVGVAPWHLRCRTGAGDGDFCYQAHLPGMRCKSTPLSLLEHFDISDAVVKTVGETWANVWALFPQTKCIASAFGGGYCAPTNQTCICTNQHFQLNVTLCVSASCTIPEALGMSLILSALCR